MRSHFARYMPNSGHSVKELPNVGKRIATRREKLGLSLTEAAKEIGISLGALANIESSKHLPGLFVYRKICRVLKVSPGKLLEGK